MRRTVFNEDHEAFRQTIRDFIAAEVVPHYPQWAEQGYVPRELYKKLGDLGVFGIEVPEEYGGAGALLGDDGVVLEAGLARA
ncbi:acyl-CoA dehydrogenase family protein, partial [Streptomyces albus]